MKNQYLLAALAAFAPSTVHAASNCFNNPLHNLNYDHDQQYYTNDLRLDNSSSKEGSGNCSRTQGQSNNMCYIRSTRESVEHGRRSDRNGLFITATVTLAAPSYTHVWGPQKGCQDTVDRDTLQLSSDVTEKSDATEQCKDWCSQKTVCTGLYVQYMFPAYGVTPFWQCYANDHKFDADTDLLCNLTTNIWGEADAYNALGRGKPAS
ncbi:hypothetical protein PRZ48_007186 [Zasmidium cellare]|uniref:Apple domain-containing protein n=1 Tax=Zasmidium cellare TaxID=395010 RepID=A0ABR0EJK0_ZASCE|nr:hypothetical protein PRZ48_007186 [Zasmidium cellare]